MSPADQRIFALVPTTLVTEAVRDPRPMTSKALKKAHQKANRGPKVSRVEQRRLDAELVDRENKEYEREKAAAKAKAAREKKVTKENVARLERKKKGIPEPSKFVRAGQATISSFFGSGGGKRKREDTEGGKGEEGTVVKKTENAPPPAKRIAIIQDGDDEWDTYQGSEIGYLSESDWV